MIDTLTEVDEKVKKLLGENTKEIETLQRPGQFGALKLMLYVGFEEDSGHKDRLCAALPCTRATYVMIWNKCKP